MSPRLHVLGSPPRAPPLDVVSMLRCRMGRVATYHDTYHDTYHAPHMSRQLIAHYILVPRMGR